MGITVEVRVPSFNRINEIAAIQRAVDSVDRPEVIGVRVTQEANSTDLKIEIVKNSPTMSVTPWTGPVACDNGTFIHFQSVGAKIVEQIEKEVREAMTTPILRDAVRPAGR